MHTRGIRLGETSPTSPISPQGYARRGDGYRRNFSIFSNFSGGVYACPAQVGRAGPPAAVVCHAANTHVGHLPSLAAIFSSSSSYSYSSSLSERKRRSRRKRRIAGSQCGWVSRTRRAPKAEGWGQPVSPSAYGMHGGVRASWWSGGLAERCAWLESCQHAPNTPNPRPERRSAHPFEKGLPQWDGKHSSQ